jgi:hypothetical protein
VGRTQLFNTTDTAVERRANKAFAPVVTLDSFGQVGILVENGTAESGGFFANGNTAAIWSPGDSTVDMAGSAPNSTGVLLAIYDEDLMTATTPPGQAAFAFTSGFDGRAINTYTNAYLSSGGTWVNASDRNLKTAFNDVDPRSVLDSLMTIKVQSWSYKREGDDIRHLGPVAQDFYGAFGLGQDDTSISTVDADGVALVAIQELARRNARLEAENARLTQANAGLESRLSRLEQLMAQLPSSGQLVAQDDWNVLR